MGPATTTPAHQAVPGLFLLAWGLFATAIGLGLVTGFRGLTEKFTQNTYASSAWMRRIPPWKWIPQRPDELARRAKTSRLVGIVFAIVGPIMTVVGVIQVLRGHIGLPRGPVLPLPMALAFIGIAVIGMAQCWRRRGPFRRAARRGGLTRAAAIVATIGVLAFGVFNAFGYMTWGIVGWLVGGLAGMYTQISSRAADSDTSRQPPTEL